MTLRIAAIASLVLGVTILLLYLTVVGKTPWAGFAAMHLREMKERTAAPAAVEPITFAMMTALPRGARVSEYSTLERRGVSLEGYVQRMLRAPDGDFHLDFAESVGVNHHLVPFLSAEITPQWHEGSKTWRFERLMALFRPFWGGPTWWDAPPRRVRLSGWLMYDYPFEGEGEKPTIGFPPHVTLWEIHPVTRIEAWDDSLSRFVEFAR